MDINRYLTRHLLEWDATAERCGLAFWDKHMKALDFVEVRNAHKQPTLHFRINRDEWRRAHFLGIGKFAALVHSHIEHDNPDPSDHDLDELAMLRSRGFKRVHGLVYHVWSRTLTTYVPDGVLLRRRI